MASRSAKDAETGNGSTSEGESRRGRAAATRHGRAV